MTISNWIHIAVLIVLVVLVLVLLHLNGVHRRRRRRILYRLAVGKTALEGPKEEPIPAESDETQDDSADGTDDGKDPSNKRIVLEEAREKLWERMEAYMKEKEPFTDPDFDRNMLSKAMFSNISYVSGAINAHGKSFTTWLAEYRVKMAINILQQTPKIPVRDLCVKVGVLNPVVFNRQFRGVTGMSVSEFRSQIGQ